MKYVLGVLGFIILTIMAVVLLASTTGNRSDNAQEGERTVALADYVESGTVSYTTQGRLTGDETFKQTRIILNSHERRVQILSGYNNAVEVEQGFANNQAAFDTFMHALANAGFSREKKTEIKDIRGVCPLGQRYLYRLQDKGQSVVDLWATSCNRREGTSGANNTVIRQLFEGQIPNYSDFTANVRF